MTQTQDAISQSHREERDRADCADRERAPKYKKRKSRLKECVLCEYSGMRVKGCCTHSQTHSHSHTLYDPMDYRLPSSSVHGILQGRILEWKAIPVSRGSSQPRQGLDPGIKPESPELQVEPPRVVDTHTHTHTWLSGRNFGDDGKQELLGSRTGWNRVARG